METIAMFQAAALAFGSTKKEDFLKFIDMLDLKKAELPDLKRELADSGIYEEK